MIGVNKNYNAAAKGIETFKKDMTAQIRYLKNDLIDSLDKKFARTGLDIEVPIMDNEGGAWEDRAMNKVSIDYKLDEVYPERIKKPL